MRRRLLLVEDSGPSLVPVLEDCLPDPAIVHCDVGEWETRPPDVASLAATDLLVAGILRPHDAWTRFFRGLRGHGLRAPVLAVLHGQVTPDIIVTAARGADEFLIYEPGRVTELRERIRRLCGSIEDLDAITARLTDAAGLANIVGEDPTFMETVAKIPIVARSDGIVLVLGETGTGKELCARAVHHLSARRHMPFVPVDCAALPDHLLENELFGHVRGAFTDAHRDQSGLVAMAEGGTLFLDEVDSLALQVQAKLLRLIEERTYKPLGSERFQQANIRIVAAANQDLTALVAERRFRSDLYFRLNVLQLRLPPLRARRRDITLLVQHFLPKLCAKAGVTRKTIAPSALGKLSSFDWPGNVRELVNALESSVVFCPGPTILASHIALPADQTPATAGANVSAEGTFREARARTVESFERSYLEALLKKHQGNVTRAAREAGKDRRVFGRLIKKHRVDRKAV